MEQNGITATKDYTPILGQYSSELIPLKIQLTEEEGTLVLNAEGQPSIPLEDKDNGLFTFEQAELSIEFAADKKGFVLSIGKQSFGYTKDVE